nr:uncharacterized mitochondrial protein AtMg00810-like [Tanacetum cinerariifolium]
MSKEIKSLEQNKTWKFTTLPPGKTTIGSKSVFRIKLNANGNIKRFKESKDSNFIKEIKTKHHDNFSIKDLGPLHYYLGIEFLRNSTRLAMTQRKYALELLECADVLDIKPIATPMDTIIKLNDSHGYVLPDLSTYRTLVGKLLYLIITKRDLSFAAQALSKYSHSPRSSHYEALLRVLRYINLYPGQVLFFPSQNTNHLTTYCDSDWASCVITRRCVTGYVVFLGHSLISRQSKKQTVVSRSSIEAEYRALVDSTCEISWLKCLLLDLGVHVPTLSLVMRDNASTIALANNLIHHARTKHIEIDWHFVRHKIRQGQISPRFAFVIPTQCQLVEEGGGKGSNTTNDQAISANPNTPLSEVKGVQTVYKLSSPPRMKILLDKSLVRCNAM